jgi:FkbM family methyltransferase
VAEDWSKYGHHELGLKEVQALTNRGGKTWGWVNGMFQGGKDDFIALRFECGFDYEPVTRALWRAVCKDAQLVVDVGTHSGVFSLDAYRAGAKHVISVEPHPINYSRLVLNLRYNGFPVSGTVFGALGEKDELGYLAVENLWFCHAAGKIGDGVKKIPTRVMKLDSALKEAHWSDVKAVKIDAENLTPSVLRGMGGILQHRPDLILECLDPGMDEILKPLGYRFWKIWETGKIEEVEGLQPYNPENNYNGTHEDCRNRFASVRELP